MDGNKILEVIGIYEARLVSEGIQPIDADPDQYIDQTVALPHCLGMIPKMREFVSENRLEKAFRWLGFIQGVLWIAGVYSLTELKNHSRPNETS